MTQPNAVVLFDFDKTLITTDSFRLFSLIASRGASERLRVLGEAVLCRAGILDNDAYKRRVLDLVWSGRPEVERDAIIETLQSRLHQLVRAAVMARLQTHLAQGDYVAVISASPEMYLRPFIQSHAQAAAIYGTRIVETTDGFTIENLYGESKLRIATSILERHPGRPSLLYTDSLSDLPLMRLVDRTQLVAPARGTPGRLRALGIGHDVIAA